MKTAARAKRSTTRTLSNVATRGLEAANGRGALKQGAAPLGFPGRDVAPRAPRDEEREQKKEDAEDFEEIETHGGLRERPGT